MQSTLKLFFTVTMVYLLSFGSAFADPALVIGIDDCSLFDGNGNPVLGVGTGVTISAQNVNGNVTHTCTVNEVTPSDSGRTAVFNIDSPETFDIQCGMDDGSGGNIAVTDDWHEVVTRNGRAKLVCQFHD